MSYYNLSMSGNSIVETAGGNEKSNFGKDNPAKMDNVVINRVPLSQPQILELRNCKVKNVSFDVGKGEIILSGDSALTGTITGGKIKG